MADPTLQKNKKSNYYTITAFIFLSLFLVIILFFSRRNLEPTLSAYRNLFYAGGVRPIDPISSDLVADSLSVSSETETSIPSSSVPTDLEIDSKVVNELLNSSTDIPLQQVPSDDQLVDAGISRSNVVVSSHLANNQTLVSGNDDEKSSNEEDVAMEGLKNCDLYMGSWVRDETYPIYKPGSCPYVDESYACQSNGRPDSDYLKWRWKPDSCELPRFNATDFLVRLRGKKLMLVGDSMNRNQFESILCVLREGLPDKSRMFETHGYKITKGRGYFMFKFVDYNCSVEFVRSHFLVKEGTRINGQGNTNPTLSIDKIDKSANKWKRADILVFNTGHWWTHGKTARGKNYYKEGDYIYPKFDAVEAYRRAIKTWGSWIDNNLNPKKHMVIYRGYSSAHFRGGDWDSGGSCNGEKEPIKEGNFLDTYPLKMKIVEEVIEQMQFPVVLLNVTRLTNFRKDGHPSIYGKNATEGKKVSKRKQDCSHWCLPGVPDAWNELIYARLVLQQRVSVSTQAS